MFDLNHFALKIVSKFLCLRDIKVLKGIEKTVYFIRSTFRKVING